jgi:YD repeat-containing protein
LSHRAGKRFLVFNWFTFTDVHGRLTHRKYGGGPARRVQNRNRYDLTSVTQPGSAVRTFSYSSLKRLLSATNPESGVTSYTYDGNGNLATRTDARLIVTNYSYNGLNQLLGKTYSDYGSGNPTP